MRSPMVESAAWNDAAEKALYTDLQVLKSPAGFYVGTIYNNLEGYQEPGSRDSGYFDTHEEAEKFLRTVINVINPTEYLRNHP